ncbi:MAG: hypothetical protein R3F34_00635 [Planctomycetota bacterium]
MPTTSLPSSETPVAVKGALPPAKVPSEIAPVPTDQRNALVEPLPTAQTPSLERPQTSPAPMALPGVPWSTRRSELFANQTAARRVPFAASSQPPMI